MVEARKSDQNARHIELSEHDEFGPLADETLSPADLDFIENHVNDDKRRMGVSFDRYGRVTLSSTAFVGVVSLPEGPTIQVEPKVAAGNLVPLLLFALRSEVDILDQSTYMEEGGRFVDAFAGLFLAELDRVLRRGLRSEYVPEESSERHLRGQLNVQRQQQRRPIAPTKFECDYDEFTYDTLLNQAVLLATQTLSSLVSSDQLSARLAERVGLLRRRISLRPVTQNEIDRIQLSRLTKYYTEIVTLVELVVRHSFIEGMNLGEQRAFSFLLNMNELYERVVEQAVARLCRDRPNWSFETQYRTDSLLDGTPTVRMYPDVIVRVDGEVAVVLDAKWKTSRSNSDIYQLLAYQSVYEVPGILVYPEVGSLETSYGVDGGQSLYLIELPTKSAGIGVGDVADRLSRKLGEDIEAAVI